MPTAHQSKLHILHWNFVITVCKRASSNHELTFSDAIILAGKDRSPTAEDYERNVCLHVVLIVCLRQIEMYVYLLLFQFGCPQELETNLFEDVLSGCLFDEKVFTALGAKAPRVSTGSCSAQDLVLSSTVSLFPLVW